MDVDESITKCSVDLYQIKCEYYLLLLKKRKSIFSTYQKKKMDLNKINERGALSVENKEVVPMNTLELNSIHAILDAKLVTTVYGDCILLELADKNFFLPKRATLVLKEHLYELNSKKYGIKYWYEGDRRTHKINTAVPD